MSNYPPGVTGNEYEIAGPDWESEVEVICSVCGAVTPAYAVGYMGDAWLDGDCLWCEAEITGSYYPEDDTDHSYDRDWDDAEFLQNQARIGGP